MTIEELEKLFDQYAIWWKKPDIIVIDVEEGDHKIVFFKKPKELDKVALLDNERRKGKYYMRDDEEWVRPCYPVIVDMYEYKDSVSGDGMPTDLRIGSREEIDLQITLALKKVGKRDIYEYTTFKG
jgi:hypothetical protein